MRKLFVTQWFVLVLLLALRVDAAPPPAAQYGAITLTALTATKVPALPLYQRSALLLTNTDGATIWCGTDASVTNSNGTPVFVNEKFSIPLSWESPAHTDVYCYSVAGTAANALRWWEVRS